MKKMNMRFSEFDNTLVEYEIRNLEEDCDDSVYTEIMQAANTKHLVCITSVDAATMSNKIQALKEFCTQMKHFPVVYTAGNKNDLSAQGTVNKHICMISAECAGFKSLDFAFDEGNSSIMLYYASQEGRDIYYKLQGYTSVMLLRDFLANEEEAAELFSCAKVSQNFVDDLQRIYAKITSLKDMNVFKD